jgi:HPt (histidine-containing phosphotransfer) domain-containing protein
MSKKTLLNTESALEMVDGDTELYRILLTAFVGDIPFNRQQLTDLIGNDNKEAAAKYIHRLKGAAAQLGAEKLADDGQGLEDMLRGKKTGDIPSAIDNFSEDYNLTFQIIKQVLQKL